MKKLGNLKMKLRAVNEWRICQVSGAATIDSVAYGLLLRAIKYINLRY
jgi:hypothetical protein